MKSVLIVATVAILMVSPSLAFAGDANAVSTSTAATNSAAMADGRQTVNFNSEAPKIPQPAPNIVISPGNTSAPCMTSSGGGISIPGGSAGFSLPKADKKCETRAMTELLMQLQQPRAALAYLCNEVAEVRKAVTDSGGSCYAK